MNNISYTLNQIMSTSNHVENILLSTINSGPTINTSNSPIANSSLLNMMGQKTKSQNSFRMGYDKWGSNKKIGFE